MARKFTEAGLESVALTGDDAPDDRDGSLQRPARRAASLRLLRRGPRRGRRRARRRLPAAAASDRPRRPCSRSSSAAACVAPTGKSHLTVIDLIGQHRREFRFEDRLRAILDTDAARRRPGRRRLPVPAGRLHGRPRSPEPRDRPRQPQGCGPTLALGDARRRPAQRVGRRHARRVPRAPRPPARGRLPPGQLDALRRDAGARRAAPRRRARGADAEGARSPDPRRRSRARRVLREPARSERAAASETFDERSAAPDDARVGARIGAVGARTRSTTSSPRSGARRPSAHELLSCSRSSTRAPGRAGGAVASRAGDPADLHARYSRQEIVAALGFARRVKPKVTQGGILWVPQAQSDVFFVDLHKAERDYSPTTMYRDYAINRELFHWESQSRQTPQQPTVQRYINHRAAGHACAALRARAQDVRARDAAVHVPRAGRLRRPPWRAARGVHLAPAAPMPEELFEVARSVAAA